jgi:hypothetical protein
LGSVAVQAGHTPRSAKNFGLGPRMKSITRTCHRYLDEGPRNVAIKVSDGITFMNYQFTFNEDSGALSFTVMVWEGRRSLKVSRGRPVSNSHLH